MAKFYGRREKLRLKSLSIERLTIRGRVAHDAIDLNELIDTTHSHLPDDSHYIKSINYGTRYVSHGDVHTADLEMRQTAEEGDINIRLGYSTLRASSPPSGWESVSDGLELLHDRKIRTPLQIDCFARGIEPSSIRTYVQTPLQISSDPEATFSHLEGVELVKRIGGEIQHRVSVVHHGLHVDIRVEINSVGADWNIWLPKFCSQESVSLIESAVGQDYVAR